MKTGLRMMAMLTALAVMALFTGCVTQQKVGPSGFLGDYPQFTPGQEGIDKRYMKEGVNFKKYSKIPR